MLKKLLEKLCQRNAFIKICNSLFPLGLQNLNNTRYFPNTLNLNSSNNNIIHNTFNNASSLTDHCIAQAIQKQIQGMNVQNKKQLPTALTPSNINYHDLG